MLPFQAAFSLLEVIMALFLLSLSLLCTVGLEVLSLRQHYITYQKSVGIAQLASMMQRIKANRASLSEETMRWNKLNQILLPNSEGKVICSGGHCKIQLDWSYHGKQTLSTFIQN